MSSRAATRIHDVNTINANTGDMTKDEVIEFFNSKRLEIKHKTGIDSQFVVNTITMQIDGRRELKGVSFIYFERSEAYHAILGSNIDGTERYEYKPDPDWLPPAREEKQEPKEIKTWDDITGDPSSKWDELVGNVKGKSWADMVEPITDKPPMIATKLPPIVEDFRYQRPDGSFVDVSVQPFFITIDDDEDEELDTYKLFGFVPSRCSVDEIKARFNIFSHRSEYPQISIRPGRNGKNIVFITFSHATHDARFAREIMMYTYFGDDVVKFDFPKSLTRQEPSYNQYRNKYNPRSYEPSSQFRSNSGFGNSRSNSSRWGDSRWGGSRSRNNNSFSDTKPSDNEYMRRRR